MALTEENDQFQNPALNLDENELYCEEGHFGEDGVAEDEGLVLLESELFWEDDELGCLICKEKEMNLCCNGLILDGFLMMVRKEAVDWILRVNGHYGFSALTTVLAVNYFDRFVGRLVFQWDKPWMSQLCAVACVSLAAKVEETQVPLLLDLQVEDAKYVLEAKTIQRMELLVLSTLQWRMNPVTPISFLDHIHRRLELKTELRLESMRRCEERLISIIADSRFLCYLPSVLATATMLVVIKELEPSNLAEYQNQLISLLKIDEDKVYECCEVMLELQSQNSHKHKWLASPSSPHGIVDAYLSSDTSNDSWL